MQMITKDSLTKMIVEANPEKQARIVGRACLVLFKRQTESERQANTTNVENSVGFTASDARTGSLTAKSFLKFNTLQPWQVERWLQVDRRGTMRIAKYWKQLDQAARAKAAAQG
jgi:hypothetical protein